MAIKFKVTSKDIKQYFDNLNVDILLHNLDSMEEDDKK